MALKLTLAAAALAGALASPNVQAEENAGPENTAPQTFLGLCNAAAPLAQAMQDDLAKPEAERSIQSPLDNALATVFVTVGSLDCYVSGVAILAEHLRNEKGGTEKPAAAPSISQP